MYRFLTLFAICITHIIYCQTPEGEVVVRLNQEHALLDVYVSNPATAETNLPNTTLEALRDVLVFDLHHNGMTKVLTESPQAQKGIDTLHETNNLDTDTWKSVGAFYLIDLNVHGKELQTNIYSINSGEHFQSPRIDLSGELATDRQKMHQLADSIHKALFGKPGIATSKILYTVSSPNSTKEKPLSDVWLADYDGFNAKKLTEENSLCVTPSFIPAQAGFRSGHYFYVSYRYGQPKIFVGTLGSPVAQRFSSIRGNQLMPQTSPRRDLVTFICDAAGNPDIFVQSFATNGATQGKPRQIFAAPRATQSSPVFSPDGKQIAFVSNKDGRPRIYLIDLPAYGTRELPKAHLISRKSYENTSPAWSPDGSMIAYSAKTEGIRQIWVYDLHADRERQLTQGPGNKENPTWAPDSLHLIFNSEDSEACELYLINLHEPTATKISQGAGRKRFPSWEFFRQS